MITGSGLSTSWTQVSSTLTSPLDAVTLKLELSGTQFSGWLAWDDASVSLEEQVITKYYYAGGQRVAVRKDGELSYLLGDPSRVLRDHLGSASVVADVDGGLLSETLYKPWGETRYSGGAVMPTDRLYTGQIAEPILGLYFYNARWVDPVLGRFAQADTIIPNPGDPQSWDRYSYTMNNPVRYTDPSGHYVPTDLDDKYFSESDDELMNVPYMFISPVSRDNLTSVQWFGGTEFAYKDHLIYMVDKLKSYNYDGYCQGYHCGIDYIAPWGTPVRAGIYGIVYDTKHLPTGDSYIEIDWGNYRFKYQALDGDFKVRKGDYVYPWTVIAGVGSHTGENNVQSFL